MTRNEIKNEYFHWLVELIFSRKRNKNGGYLALLKKLNETDFNYIIAMDSNRETDGINLRYRFGREKNVPQTMVATFLDDKPCSIFEMMVALAVTCEEHIAVDTEFGDRTGDWFWDMIDSLGLTDFSHSFNETEEEEIDYILDRFLDREYKSDGEGGLFTVRNCRYDLRSMEIWYQMHQYLDYKLNT